MTPSPRTFNRILLCVTEDWFALSHFKPLIRALQRSAGEVVVATRDNGSGHEVASLGVRFIAFDFARRSRSPRAAAATVRRLAQLIADVEADAVHLVAVQTIMLGAAALLTTPRIAAGLHITGLGVLGRQRSLHGRLASRTALAALGLLLRRRNAQVFLENPEDRDIFRTAASWPLDRITQLGGAGVDPQHFQPLAEPVPPRIGFSGRLVHQKGVHVLIDAMRLLRTRGIAAELDLFAKFDATTADAYSRDDLERWQRDGLARWHGHVEDIRTAWAAAAICVAPSTSREGLPRAILEAAACGRPLIVTDVAGSRHFVRDGIEGRIVPPDDAAALAEALAALLADPAARHRMGAAARSRVLDAFTERHVEDAIAAAYHVMAAAG